VCEEKELVVPARTKQQQTKAILSKTISSSLFVVDCHVSSSFCCCRFLIDILLPYEPRWGELVAAVNAAAAHHLAAAGQSCEQVMSSKTTATTTTIKTKPTSVNAAAAAVLKNDNPTPQGAFCNSHFHTLMMTAGLAVVATVFHARRDKSCRVA
jgi:hypothetical protein